MRTLIKSSLLVATLLSASAAFAGPAGAPPPRPSPQQQQQQRQVVRPVAPPPAAAARVGIARAPALAAKIGGLRRSMETDIHDGATPFLEIATKSDSVRLHQTGYPDYEKGTIAKYNVSGVANGQLDLVALLPVSGHVTGQAANYAKSNVYNMVITHADGRVETLGKTPSTGYVTEKDLSIQLKPGVTKIQFWADGSAGVGGYRAGREIEFNWNGQ